MPAKKTTAKKTSTRRSAPAKTKKTAVAKKSTTKKTAAKKTTAKKTAANRTATIDKDLAYENLREDELTSQYPAMRKNNFLSLIVLGLGTLLVLVGIYIQINKDNPPTTVPAEQNNSADVMSGEEQDNNGASATDTEQNAQLPLPANDNAAFPVDAQKMVETFYGYFNEWKFDQMPTLFDSTFTTDPGLVQYFSPSRLESRKQNIIGDIQLSDVNAVIDHPIVQRNEDAMVVQYNTSYILQNDGLTYGETWYSYIIRENGQYVINGFECQQNCAASPFFRFR